MACVVTPSGQTGLSVYKNDFKTQIPTETYSPRFRNRLRRNRPHPQKDFLLPSRINDGIELQQRVRRAVREYMDEIYSGQGGSGFSSQHPPLFYPPRIDDDLQPQILMPKGSEKTYRAYPFHREASYEQRPPSRKTFPERERTSTAVVLERSPPSRLQGESKRDRSIRIRQEIEQKNRNPTPTPQPKKWQRVASAAPVQKHTTWSKPKQARALSAPPVRNSGYSYYKQATKEVPPEDAYRPVQEKLLAWADNANDYEKQVIYNLLNRAAGPRQGPPVTPPSPQEAYHLLLKAKSFPAERSTPQDYDETNDKRRTWSPYFKDVRRNRTKQRNLNSAPVKPMLGLVPNATQYPHRDQRAFRLRGQDSRIKGNPDEEREVKEHMRKIARVTQRQWKQPEKKYLIAPMRSYTDRRGSMPKDYKCDVSFFQSVRAPLKSHFVIHPDFTSETTGQKKRADQMISHFRY